MAKITLRIDSSRLSAEVRSNGGTLGRAANRAGRRVTARARDNAPVDAGTLRQSIGYRVKPSSGGLTIQVYARARHAVYVHQGTGKGAPSTIVLPGNQLPGPSGNFIYARRGKALRWENRGPGQAGFVGPVPAGFVFRRRTAGVDANPFLAKAARSVTPADFY